MPDSPARVGRRLLQGTAGAAGAQGGCAGNGFVPAGVRLCGLAPSDLLQSVPCVLGQARGCLLPTEQGRVPGTGELGAPGAAGSPCHSALCRTIA